MDGSHPELSSSANPGTRRSRATPCALLLCSGHGISLRVMRLPAKRGEEDPAGRRDRDATTYPDMANLRTGSVDAVLPCFRDDAVPRRATAGR
jgi:hypothetical protein